MKRISLLLVLLPLAGMLTGCVAYQPIRFEPVVKATPVAPRFTESYYFFDRDKNLYFIMRSHTTDRATGKAVDQVATIRVFWHPRGGVTTLNATALNATFRYLIMTPDAVGMYEGAGFVRLESKDGDYKFEARVVDGDMRLTQASSGFNDTLGRTHVRGYFNAIYNDAQAMDMLIQAHRDFFARSMDLKPATQPATGPAGAPSTGPGVAAPENWGIPSSATLPGVGPATTPAP